MSTPPSKPTILLIPGSFSPSFLYAPLIETLQSHSYPAQALDLRSVGPASVSGITMADDAAHIASVIEPLVDDGKGVLLVAHSYGGIPTTEAVKGYGVGKRDGKGGVVGIVYFAALVPELGGSAMSLMGTGQGLPDHVKLDGLHMTIDPLLPCARETFSDIPEEQGLELVKQFPGHSAASFMGELSYEAYTDVPVSYLLCEEDRVVPPEIQERMVKMMKEKGAKIEVVRVKSGHCPNVSQPEVLIRVIRKAAGESL